MAGGAGQSSQGYFAGPASLTPPRHFQARRNGPRIRKMRQTRNLERAPGGDRTVPPKRGPLRARLRSGSCPETSGRGALASAEGRPGKPVLRAPWRGGRFAASAPGQTGCSSPVALSAADWLSQGSGSCCVGPGWRAAVGRGGREAPCQVSVAPSVKSGSTMTSWISRGWRSTRSHCPSGPGRRPARPLDRSPRSGPATGSPCRAPPFQ